MSKGACFADAELLPVVLGDPATGDVDAHLRSCVSCSQRVQFLRAEVQTLSRQVESLSTNPETGVEATVCSGNGIAKIGRYRVLGRLAKGGQGEVFRVAHPTLEQELVLKLARSSLEKANPLRSHLVQEGRTLATLDHPGLARVYDLDFDEQGRPFLVLEYVRGRNLRQHAEQHDLGSEEAAPIVAGIARAVGAIHRVGIVHRDIKPDNVVIDPSGRPRLIDFGLARVCSAWEEMPAEDSILGTPGYMPPEQANGEMQRVGPVSDVFSIGAILYELLTRKRLYEGRDTLDTLKLAQTHSFDREALADESIPTALAEVCLAALARNPQDRFSSCDVLADALASAQSKGATSRRRWLVVAGVLAVVAVPVFGDN